MVHGIFKTALEANFRAALQAADFEVRDLPRNPFAGR